jgi:uncharacterized membrane protein
MKPPKIFPIVFFLILIVTAACFRLYGLTFQSLWLDELLSINYSIPGEGIDLPIRYAIAKDGSPPLFNISLWIWRSAFGAGEYPARLLPALFGILGVFCMYFLGKELISVRAGMYASLLTAVLPFHIYYSQEVRPYSLLFLLSVLSYLFFIRLLKLKNLRWGLPYVLATSCMLYTHYFGLLVLLAQLAYLGVILLWGRDVNKKNLVKLFLPLGLLMALTYLPWLARFRRLTEVKKIWADIPPSDFFVSYFKGYFGNEFYVVLICACLLGLYLLHKSNTDEFPYQKVLLFTCVLSVFAVPYLRALTHAALLTPRNTIVALPAIILMVCVGIARFRRREIRLVVFGSILLMLFVNIFFTNGNYYRTVTKEQWREAAKYVIVKDPEGKYPVFVDGRIRYYFYDVFKSGRQLWPQIQTRSISESAIKFISEQRSNGFWVIETHQPMDEAVRQYLETQHSVKLRKPLRGAQVTFYVPREPQK